ncbi:MAG: Fic family protein [Methanothrix sp.]
MTGKSSRPTPLRKRKSVIESSLTGDVVYLPPRPEDLPELIAALVYYQLAAIHPFNDGNGRTARLCADFILMRDGYDLSGLIMPVEKYAEDLDSYHQALNVHRLTGSKLREWLT